MQNQENGTLTADVADGALSQQRTIALLEGVNLRRLVMHGDERGSVTELFRESWGFNERLVQWNIVQSEPHVLRGVHVHLFRHDLLSVLTGRMLIGLRDLRRESSTFGRALTVELSGENFSILAIPPGVVHGVYSLERSVMCSAFSADWDPADDFGCHWADKDLAIPWPTVSFQKAIISEKDSILQTFSQLLRQLPEGYRTGSG